MLLHRHGSEMRGRERGRENERGVKERLKGKDSLREKRLRECQTGKKKKKNGELLREGGKDTKGGRDKENKRGE